MKQTALQTFVLWRATRILRRALTVLNLAASGGAVADPKAAEAPTVGGFALVDESVHMSVEATMLTISAPRHMKRADARERRERSTDPLKRAKS